MDTPNHLSPEDELTLLRGEFAVLRRSSQDLSVRAEALAREVEHLKAQQRRDQLLLQELRGSKTWKVSAPARRTRLRVRNLIASVRR